jgi:hypothetical protein
MWRQARSWIRFTVFVAGNSLALAGVYILAIEPAIEALRERESRIEQSAIRLEQLRSAVARKQSMSKLDANEIEHATKRFLQGSNESLSTADLLTRLRQVADDHAVSFSSVTTLPSRNWFGRQLVGARIEFATGTPRVAEVMAGIEEETCFLFIRSARLTSPDEAASNAERLGVIIEVYGVTRWSSG